MVWFRLPLNAGKPYAEQIKPFNFLLTAHVLPFGLPTGLEFKPERFQLVAPWIDDPLKWTRTRWIDRYSGQTFAITTEGDTGGPELARDLLLARPPRIEGLAAGQPIAAINEDGPDAARRVVSLLRETALPIQGPPGSGTP
jgi:hypothetical protein